MEEEGVFEFSVSDFATIVKTTMFVDNTLMIRDIFRESSRVLITAPHRFGKSTNIDMVRRFLEIEVDTIGTPKLARATNNYRLFKDNNLDICSDEEFFNEHFAKYPVVRINCAPLSNAYSFVNMLDVFRTIVTKTFNQHIYLLDAARFKIKEVYFDDDLIKNVDESDLVRTFEYLSKILYRQFRKAVFVLIDDCDAFINSVLLENNNPDADRIINFMKTTLGNLLGDNQYVGRALLTGVLPVCTDRFFFHQINVDCYCFLGNHRFFKYYGLTTYNLRKILSKFISDDAERKKITKTINTYYSGYRVHNQTVQVYSIWSVLQYLRKREVQCYLYNHEFVKGFKLAFKILKIGESIEQIISGNKLVSNTSQLLSVSDILQLSEATAIGKDEGASSSSSSVVHTFLQLLCHFGYLCVDKVDDWGFVSLKIANEEMKCELLKILIDTQRVDCDITAHADSVSSATVSSLCKVSKNALKSIEKGNETITTMQVYYISEVNQSIEKLTFREILRFVDSGKVLNSSKDRKCLKRLLKGVWRIDVEIQSLVISNTDSVCNILQLDAVVVKEMRSVNIVRCRSALYTLLYYCGFLAVTRMEGNCVYCRVSNDKARYRLAKVLVEIDQTYNYQYQEYVNNISCAVDLIQPDGSLYPEMIKTFGKTVNSWFKNENGLCDEELLLPCLYVILLTQSDYSETFLCKFDGDIILLKNRHHVGISISAEVDFMEVSIDNARIALDKSSKEYIFNELSSVSGIAAIGIGGVSMGITVQTSYCFKYGDSLKAFPITMSYVPRRY